MASINIHAVALAVNCNGMAGGFAPMIMGCTYGIVTGGCVYGVAGTGTLRRKSGYLTLDLCTSILLLPCALSPLIVSGSVSIPT
jgi:hypothetical protein